MWKYTKVCVNSRSGNTRFHMWKFTWDCVFPHVEIHQKLWISKHAEIHIFWCISTCGNSSGKVNFRMSVYKRICEFPRGKTCGNTRFFADFRMRKYTRICEFPRAEIHAERCITACGNTLNQVKENSSICLLPWAVCVKSLVNQSNGFERGHKENSEFRTFAGSCWFRKIPCDGRL